MDKIIPDFEFSESANFNKWILKKFISPNRIDEEIYDVTDAIIQIMYGRSREKCKQKKLASNLREYLRSNGDDEKARNLLREATK